MNSAFKLSFNFFFILLGLSLSFLQPILASTYFKKNYTESRQEFLRFNTDWAKGKIKYGIPFKVPSQKDSDLTVDSLLLGQATDQNLLVIVSGVHGPESFVGSAIQHFFMNEKALRFLEKNVSLLLIHSLNPYGFKYGRRVTENNVDLNRNFLEHPAGFKDWNLLNPSFAKLRPLLEPQGQVSSPLKSMLRLSQGMVTELLVGDMGRAQINNVVAGGQFEFPQALFFGGQQLEPQTGWLKTELNQTFQNFKKIVILDLHTGLGDSSVLHVISSQKENQITEGLGLQFTTFLKNRSEIKLTQGSDPGFYHTKGDLLDGLLSLKRPEQVMVALTLEFGTVGSGMAAQLKSLNRMILENQGHFHGYSNPKVEAQCLQDFRQLFNPESDQWRSSVIDRSEIFFTQLLSAF